MARIFGTPGQEAGDQLTYEALSGLPEDWLVYAQPILILKSETRTPDYVIVHREIGVVVLEVKDWARIIEWGHHDVVILRDSKEVREASPVLQARRAAELLSNILREDRDLRGFAGKFRFPYRYAGVLAHQPMSVITQLREDGYVLGRDDLRTDVIEARLRAVPAPFCEPMEERHIRAVCAAIDPLIKISDPSTGGFKGIYDREQEQIAKEPLRAAPPSAVDLSVDGAKQLRLEPDPSTRLRSLEADIPVEHLDLKTTPHVRLVRGFAGTGKSDILILRAHYLARQEPPLTLLVTTFNDPLFRERLEPELKAVSHRVDVIKFDTLCSKVYQARHGRWVPPQDTAGLIRSMAEHDDGLAKLGVEFLADEFIWMKETGRTTRHDYVSASREGRGGLEGRRLSREMKECVFDAFEAYQRELYDLPAHDWVDLHTKVAKYLDEGTSPDKLYDVILIDEAQHFAPTWIRIILHFLKEGGSLFVCDDPSQSVYRTFSWRQKGVDVAGRTRWLRVPYRCTRQVFEAAYSLIANNSVAMKMLHEAGSSPSPDTANPAIREGPMPLVRRFSTVVDENEFVSGEMARLVSEEGLLPREIGILHTENFVLERYKATVPAGVKRYEIRRQTGLEYRAVFVPEIQRMDERTVGLSLEEDFARQSVRFYSAMTRARTWLYLTYQQRWPKVLDAILPYCNISEAEAAGRGQTLSRI